MSACMCSECAPAAAAEERKLRDALNALLEAQPRCDMCEAVATRGGFSGAFCADHGFSTTPELKTAPAIRQARQALAKTA